MSSVMSIISLFKSTPGLILYILETIILYQIGVSYCGLRFIPIYGDYYFYKSVLPNKKKLSLVYALTNLFANILAIVCVLLIVWALESNKEVPFLTVFFYLSFGLFFICLIASNIIVLPLKLDMAVKFEFPKPLGILFWILPLIGDICLLINSGKYNKQPTDEHTDTVPPTTETNVEPPMFETFEENMKPDVEKETYNVYEEEIVSNDIDEQPTYNVYDNTEDNSITNNEYTDFVLPNDDIER